MSRRGYANSKLRKLDSQQPKEGLWTNGILLDLPDKEIEVGIIKDPDREKLQDLRAQLRGTHVIISRGIELMTVALKPEEEVYGKKDSVRLRSPTLCRELVRAAWIERLLSKAAHVLRGYPNIEFLSKTLVGKNLPGIGDICDVYIGLEIAFRHVAFRQSLRLAAFVQTRLIRSMISNCEQLTQRGIDVHGLYVGTKELQSDPRLQRKLTVWGRVASVTDGQVQLDDRCAEADCLPLMRAVPARWESNLQILLRGHGHSAKATQEILNALREEALQHAHSHARQVWFDSVRRSLHEEPLELLADIQARYQRVIRADRDLASSSLSKPRFSFSADGAVAGWHFHGLKKYGPWHKPDRLSKGLIVRYLYQARHRHEAQRLVQSLQKGVQDAYPPQLAEKLGFTELRATPIELQGSMSQDYRKGVADLVSCDRNEQVTTDLVLMVTEESFKGSFGNLNPYLVSKAALLTQGMPSQAITIEKLRDIGGRAYILRNIALQAFAKLGGIPWQLQRSQADDGTHEVIIGLKQAEVGRSRFQSRKRSVGVAALFTAEGDYIATHRSESLPIDQHEVALGEALRQSLEEAKCQAPWLPEDEVRIVVHSFKPWKRSYVQRLHDVVSSVHSGRTVVALVHVVYYHPFFLFDGFSGHLRGKHVPCLGEGIPRRGQLVTLDRNSALLTTTERGDMGGRRGFPQPLRLELHRSSTYGDIESLATQVSHLTHHSWRGFGVSALPVTMLYAGRIARTLEELSAVDGWDPAVLSGRMNERPWFL